MILADVFPVFCPRVLVQSSNPWTRYSSQSDGHYRKMWSAGDSQQLGKNTHQIARQYPDIIPIPDKLHFDRRDTLRLFSDTSFKSRPTNSSLFSESSPFRSPQMTESIPPNLTPFLETSNSQLPFRNPGPGFLHMSQSFKQPSSITDSLLRSPDTTLQGTLFKRRVEMDEGLRCSLPKSQVPSHVIRSSPFCSSRAVGLYRKQSSTVSHNKKLYTCPQCKYVTDRKNNLKRHISTMHQDSAKVLECCGMVFRSKALLRDHVSLFHRSGYRCQYCGRNFCRKALLRRHLTVHSGQKDFTCPQCGYATSHKSNLERHRKIHDRKYSLNGEPFSDTDSNDMPHYMDVISSPSTSPDSIPTESPTQYTQPESRETCGSHTRMHRSALSDHIRETHRTGETIVSTEHSLPTAVPVSMDQDFTGFVHSTVPRLGHGIAVPLPHPMKVHLTTDFFNPERNIHNTLERFSSKFMLEGRDRNPSTRLFPNPYKCCDCLEVFSQQKLFNKHSCRSENRLMLSPPISVIQKKRKLSENRFEIEGKIDTVKEHEIEGDKKKTKSVTKMPAEVCPMIKPTTDNPATSSSNNNEDEIICIDSHDVNENVDKEPKRQ